MLLFDATDDGDGVVLATGVPDDDVPTVAVAVVVDVCDAADVALAPTDLLADANTDELADATVLGVTDRVAVGVTDADGNAERVDDGTLVGLADALATDENDADALPDTDATLDADADVRSCDISGPLALG